MHTVPRLVNQFRPTNYHLQLRLEREQRRFSGTVRIVGEKLDDSAVISLHAKDLKILAVQIDGHSADHEHAELDELRLTAPGLTSGEHTVEVTFSGAITDAMHGMYPCYFTHDGQKKELLATQFESHHAREVFPCIDEPEAKATFDVTLETEPEVAVIGNMPIKIQTTTANSLVTTFETTSRMSTYLLAFVVGELQSLSGTSKSGVTTTIWATKAQAARSLQFALDTAVRTIDFFNDYFGIPYPLPKADHVALPDFSAGAMENWGLITYREAALLADAQNASLESQQLVAAVIAHELSHQWFGNLVTMRWWDDLWLNESFASLMEYVALDALFPNWHYWEHFTSRESLPALQRDSIPGVQAVKTPVNHPDEISTLFDPAIVYAKGAKVLRMLRAYIGDEAFRAGLKRYFSENAYKNTEGKDLWHALESTAHKKVEQFMAAWIEQPGFPMIQASLEGKKLHLQQAPFSIGVTPITNNDARWPIPLGGLQPATTSLLEDKSTLVEVDTEQPLLLNHDDTAHFITAYDTTLRMQLTSRLKNGQLTVVDRLNILNQYMLLARGRVQSASELVQLLPAYAGEAAAPVWQLIGAAFGLLERCIEPDTKAEAKLHKLIQSITWPLYEQLGWEKRAEDTENDILLRNTIVGLLVHAKNPDVIAKAQAVFTPELETLDGNLRSSILTAVILRHEHPEKIATTLLETYRTTAASDIKQDIVASLASAQSQTILETALAALTTDTVRPQDVRRWFLWLLRNPRARSQTWQWMKTNWQWIESTFAGDKTYDIFPTYTANYLQTAAELRDYQEFFKELRQQPALSRVIAVGETEIQGRVAWLEADASKVRRALESLAD
ncbi:MAG TPA: M1 family metallopeptidase [Verrucomicrobiae bacterium]|nr:M1 family metallopeptidase [Verrucomicrobiae bacterium]